MKSQNYLAFLVIVYVLPGFLRAEQDDLQPAEKAVGVESNSFPSWWFSLWVNPVIVVKGKIVLQKERRIDIVLTDNDADKGEKIVDENSGFFLGILKPSELLFASPGLDMKNSKIKQLLSGDMPEIEILIPNVFGKFLNNPHFGLPENQELMLIFDYQDLFPKNHLILSTNIPENQLEQAKEIFRVRNTHAEIIRAKVYEKLYPQNKE